MTFSEWFDQQYPETQRLIREAQDDVRDRQWPRHRSDEWEERNRIVRDALRKLSATRLALERTTHATL